MYDKDQGIDIDKSSAAAPKTKIIAIVGPTASGKSGLAMRLAQKLDGSIICCDSMQIYRGMDIGTAKPTAEDMRIVPHRMFDIVSPQNAYSCADYVRDAEAAIRETVQSGRLPILCGGTGLYLESLLMPRAYSATSGRTDIRTELEMMAAAPDGRERLHKMLGEVDPISAEAIHKNNVRRVIRAIEIYRESGIPKSELDRRSRECASVDQKYDALVIGLRYPDRSLLRQRIAQRVDEMLDAGLGDEVRRLMVDGAFECVRSGSPPTAAQAIGYKEMIAVLESGEIPESARDDIITATCRYAKRQMTWFSAKPYIRWIDITEDSPAPDDEALKLINDFLTK